MNKINLKIKKISKFAQLPAYATEGAAGMDLYAANEEPITLAPLERKLVPLGFTMELPAGYEAQIRPRSGMAIKRGITLSNCVGTVDEDYRGEVCVGLVNLSRENYTIQAGVFSNYEAARRLADQLNNAGFSAKIVKEIK